VITIDDATIQRWKNWPTKQGAAINRIIKRHEAEVLAWNTENQLLNKGIGGNSAELFPKYARSTLIRKASLSKEHRWVTLKDTGAFHKNFDIIYSSDQIEITSNDSLKSWLQNRYGKEIFGLTEENLNKLRAIVREELPQEILNNV
jgi:hypothetical protein